ncbi:hypothetical protein FN976_22620 [Caenimonas sedimenti]|uniref:Uncharacterized protein n=1 Tax=Caenimonas sedimenti TaxID=2596921 RepID=A0A562ZIL3_9BURK|nr:hypothetical protein [Caenimonas sedimenti]TWO68429.1 hypothetical protein FN976_22620 [Caenimonas sedimenti]
MPNQEESRDGVPRKDQDRPSPDVGRAGREAETASANDYRGDGPGKIGLTSDEQPDLVSPSGVNERDHGAAEDKPMAGGALNFDDDDMVHPRGKITGAGRTWDDKNPSDAGDLGPPGAGLSDRNGPSDPDNKKTR